MLVAIRSEEQYRTRLWSFVHVPPRQDSAVQHAVPKLSPPSGLPCLIMPGLNGLFRQKSGWDDVEPDYPFLSVRIHVPLRLCQARALAVALLPKVAGLTIAN
jgi:hypothetical protein